MRISSTVAPAVPKSTTVNTIEFLIMRWCIRARIADRAFTRFRNIALDI